MKEILINTNKEQLLFLSGHAQQRLKERKGFNRKAMKRYILRALELGVIIQETIEEGRRKVIKMFNDDCLIYFIDSTQIKLVTVITSQSTNITTFQKGKIIKRTLKSTLFV